MSVLVVGSVALDTIETPFGKADYVLGGSASYFSLSAINFTDVNVVAVIGEDFPSKHLELFDSKGINIDGLKKEQGNTFRWEGKYGYDLGDPDTLGTYLNVFETFNPELPDEYRRIDNVFLANIDPEIQLKVLDQVESPKIVACDTMNFWIENKVEKLKELLKRINILIINDSEARELSGEPLITNAARKIMNLGPEMLVVKRGEYGALMFSEEGIFFAPSYLLEKVFDPTGAGDTFAGGFMGYIASNDINHISDYKRAVVYGSVLASFTVEDFSINRLAVLKKEEIESRYRAFLKLSNMD
ncbi:MAG: sugar kinase [Candidatus Dadabacteria bacterium]|nr:sugar kinase [Candidatus Dadabacteria bacterium]NIQ12991.1 sugar kinase [Candidatus Dadabacteria bacterium]